MSAREIIAGEVSAGCNAVDWERGRTDSEDVADAILSALRSAGFAVVPVEPTEGMMRAYYQCMEGTHPTARMNPDKYLTHNLKANTRWRAMLKAAQEDSRE